jgi:hypothetical protein
MDYCESCGAVGETCCSAAKARQETAVVRAGIVERQSARLSMLSLELYEARKEAAGLRQEIADWVGTPR